MVVSRQPIFIVNLKSNTMKNTLQSKWFFQLPPNISMYKPGFITSFNIMPNIAGDITWPFYIR
jgi:hypothetical protein